MPVCKGCGASYDDKHEFCSYCGRAKPEPESAKVQVSISFQDKWETCRIYTESWEEPNYYSVNKYWAEAIGPNGKYLAGESSPFRYYFGSTLYQKKGYTGAGPAHNFLVNQLASDGWEAINSGGEWWETQFRRRVDENNPRPWTLWVLNPKTSGIKKHQFNLTRIKGTKKIKGKECADWVIHGLSTEFKGGFVNIGRSEEMERILEEFVRKMMGENFEPIPQKANENLKKCFMEDTSSLWFFRALLKRK
jgi:hypothetical protein